MSRIFLGRWWHWLALAVVAGLLWLAGAERLHVVEFNTFVLLLLGGVAVVLAGLLFATSPGEQVTRDPIPEPTEDDTGTS